MPRRNPDTRHKHRPVNKNLLRVEKLIAIRTELFSLRKDIQRREFFHGEEVKQGGMPISFKEPMPWSG